MARLALSFLVLAALALVACSVAAPRPNIVLIVLDTTRADLLSAYGHPAPTSPRLAELAGGGARFERAYATDFWTLPSHASLFTGRYPSEHGATSESNQLAEEVDTLAELLAAAGHRTAAFVSNPWVSRGNGFSQGFETFEETWRADGGSDNADRLGVSRAVRFIERQAAGSEPFFVFLNLNWAHLPYNPDPAVLHEVAPGARSVDRVRRLKKIVGTWEYLAGAYELDDQDFEILRDLYQGDLRTVDARVGELVDSLRARGILDETLIVVTSDHGENLGDHGLIDHMLSMYDTTTRIPLIVRYPPRVPAGVVVHDLASLVDIVPTVLDAAGIEAPEPASGRSLLDPSARPPSFVVAENERPVNGIRLLEKGFPDFDTSRIDGRMRMLRTDRHKLIWREGQDPELYDLASDPEERQDLSEALPDVRDELMGELQAWMAARADSRRPAAKETLPQDPETREQLRALGYIE